MHRENNKSSASCPSRGYSLIDTALKHGPHCAHVKRKVQQLELTSWSHCMKDVKWCFVLVTFHCAVKNGIPSVRYCIDMLET
jgi:hypothetical protein